MLKNNNYSIYFGNSYAISKLILTSTRNAKLKPLNKWNDTYLVRKENEAIKDLGLILKEVGFEPSLGWLVGNVGEDKLELYSLHHCLIMHFDNNFIIVKDEKQIEYVYSITEQRLVEKREPNSIIFDYNPNKLVIKLFLNKNNKIRIIFLNGYDCDDAKWVGYEEDKIRNLLDELTEAPDIYAVFKIIWENLNCRTVDITFNDDNLIMIDSIINYLKVNNQEYQVGLSQNGWFVINSILKIKYNQDLTFKQIDNKAGEQISSEQVVENIESGQKAISLVRKKIEEIIPKEKK